MVNHSPAALDATFGALADPTRRAILEHLARGGATAGELAAPFLVSRPAISRHLRVLEAAGLIIRRRDGRIHRVGLAAGPLLDAATWIAETRRFWEQQFEALEDYLGRETRKESTPWPEPPRRPQPPSVSSGRSMPRGRSSSRPGPTRRR